MTAAEYLTDWKERNRLTDAQAAVWLHCHPSTFARQRKGAKRTPRQTLFLAELYPVGDIEALLQIVELLAKVAKLRASLPLSRREPGATLSQRTER